MICYAWSFALNINLHSINVLNMTQKESIERAFNLGLAVGDVCFKHGIDAKPCNHTPGKFRLQLSYTKLALEDLLKHPEMSRLCAEFPITVERSWTHCLMLSTAQKGATISIQYLRKNDEKRCFSVNDRSLVILLLIFLVSVLLFFSQEWIQDEFL